MRNYSTTSTKESRDALTTLLCDELEKGHSYRVACDLHGVSEHAVWRWKRQAEAGDDEAIQLVRRLTTARARGLNTNVNQIKLAAEAGDWRANAWLIDKQYPGWLGDKAEELVLVDPEAADEAAEEEQRKATAWSSRERLRYIVVEAIQAGVVTIEELPGLAPQPRPTAAQPEPPSNGPTADHIMETIVVALAGGDRDLRELTDCIVNTLGCTADQVFAAYDRLSVEQVQRQGAKTLLHLDVPPRIPERTNEDSGPHQDVAQTPSEPPQVPATPPSSGWLDGGGEGVGDMIARRRGR